MNEKKPVVVYGVSGYTGRLVCEYLREYNIPFIAAGRDAAKVKAVVEKIPGIETADYEIAEVEHTVEALAKLFKGAKFVSNMVGHSSSMARSCRSRLARVIIPIRRRTGWVCWQDAGGKIRGKRIAARAQHRQMTRRRNRSEHMPRTPGSIARHPGAVEGFPHLCLDADDFTSSRRTGTISSRTIC